MELLGGLASLAEPATMARVSRGSSTCVSLPRDKGVRSPACAAPSHLLREAGSASTVHRTEHICGHVLPAFLTAEGIVIEWPSLNRC